MAPSLQTKAAKILSLLKKTYPESRCSLRYENHFQLLIATILSAQCTDAKVNQVTPLLFSRYPDARILAEAELKDIEKILKPLGLYKNKAENIRACARRLRDDFQGRVPGSEEELSSLAGVGRKTAHVVLGVGFGIPAVVVDTHVKRIAGRLGLTCHENPLKIEKDLTLLFPREDWSLIAHLFIDHGRAVCRAIRPDCVNCQIRDLCAYCASLNPASAKL